MRAEQFLYVNYVLQYVNGHADVLSKNKKNIKIFPVKIFVFTTKTISVYCMGVFS